LSERFASFFRLNKSQTIPDVEAGKSDEVDQNKEENGTAVVEEKTGELPNGDKSIVTNPKMSDRIASFFRMNKSQSVDIEQGKWNKMFQFLQRLLLLNGIGIG